MVCRVIPAGCVSVDKGKCFVMKLVGHRGKPDGHGVLQGATCKMTTCRLAGRGGATDIDFQIGVENRDYHHLISF